MQRQREVVDAFLAAARDGDFEALLAVLDPDVVVRADQGAVPAGVGGSAVTGAASGPVRGAAQVARRAMVFAQLGLLTQPALVNGVAGAVTTRDGWRSRSAPSPSAAGRSSRSTSWPTPIACVRWT